MLQQSVALEQIRAFQQGDRAGAAGELGKPAGTWDGWKP